MKRVTIHKLDKKEDGRGWLLKMLMNGDIKGNKKFGEIYITTANPGAMKGSHYHEQCTEWFCVIKGKAKLILMDKNGSEKQEIIMGDDNMVTVEIPSNIIHAVKNIGDDKMYLIAYADNQYDCNNPDTIPYNMDL